ncbi:MAG: UV DNA damage repair endonuclease UvsE [Planctomycetaceae bacterium]|jgi:UV DNA damage endonuclease|nr:UV DNA damage repair endonuclease UvsE [Planctomycetaceae bacterium]
MPARKKTSDADALGGPFAPVAATDGLRLGLCCQFIDEPIRFRTTTAAACLKMSPPARAAKLAELCRANAEALLAAIECCHRLGIGAFRVNSQILPVKTHPEVGYRLEELPQGEETIALFQRCGVRGLELGVRTSFHPDQYVVLSSPRDEVVDRSLEEIEYQAEVAEWIGADTVNIHGGGAYDSRAAALDRFAQNLNRLTPRARQRLTIENDDKIYTPAELLPLCRREGTPLVYDVHHHRCCRDELSVDEATEAAIATWNREPLFHLSSPKEGWNGPGCQRHHDFIDPTDVPACWLGQALTIEVEAKAKERAVLRLHGDLQQLKGNQNAQRGGARKS